VEELLLVRGVTPAIFYGSYLTNGEGEGKTVWEKGLVDLVTVYSRSTRVDVNTAPKEVLMSIPGLNKETVERIIEARSEKPLKNLNTLRQLLGNEVYIQVFRYLTITPSMVYSIVSTGSISESGVKRRVKGIVRINSRSERKYQIMYWADNYPIAENLIFLTTKPWEEADEELL
jgi:general secretion pathway protein K